MKAEEIMTEEVSTVSPDATIGEAIEIFEALDIRHLPIIQGRELVGMVSDRDIRDAGFSNIGEVPDVDRIQTLSKQKVGEIMSSDIITVDPEASVREIIELMIDEKVGAIPVVLEHDNSLVGLVSYIDVLRVAADVL